MAIARCLSLLQDNDTMIAVKRQERACVFAGYSTVNAPHVDRFVSDREVDKKQALVFSLKSFGVQLVPYASVSLMVNFLMRWPQETQGS